MHVVPMKWLTYFWVLLAMPSLALEIELPPRAELIDRADDAVTEYRIPLSPVQQASQELRIDDLAVISGARSRWLIKFPRGSELDAAYQRLRLDQATFECEGRACGRSNLWANTLFEVSQLYGRDRNQRYQVLKLDQGYRLLYVIERGNKDIFALVEQVVPTSLAQPVYELTGVFDDQDRLQALDVEQIRRWVQLSPERQWQLQVQISDSQPYEQLLERSANRTRQLNEALSGQNIEIRDLGPSADSRIVLIGF